MEASMQMIDKSLQDYLNEVLLVPFEKDFVTRLSDVADLYFASEDVDYEAYSDISVCVLTEYVSDEFIQFIKSKYEEEYGERLKELPKPVYLAIQGYCLFHAILDEEDSSIKLIYALIIVNNLIIRHNSLKRCPFQNQVKECESFVFDKLKKDHVKLKTDCSDIYDQIFNKTLSVSINNLSEEDQHKYDAMAAKSWTYDLNEAIAGIFKSESNTIVRGFKVIEWIFDNIPSIRIKVPISEILRHHFKNADELRPLGDYHVLMVESEVELFDDDSFQVIPNIENAVGVTKRYLTEVRLSIREFLCYLYFEILLDKLIEQNGE